MIAYDVRMRVKVQLAAMTLESTVNARKISLTRFPLSFLLKGIHS